MVDGMRQKCPDPVFIAVCPHVGRGFFVVAGAHAQQVLHPHGRQIIADGCGQVVFEKRHNFVVNRQLSLGHCHPNGCRRETFAERIQRVFQLRGVGCPPALSHNLPVPNDHQAVQI